MLTEEQVQVEAYAGKSLHEVIEDTAWLRSLQEDGKDTRRKIRDIVDGGPQGIAALLGQNFKGDTPPVNNLLYSGLNRLAQKIGRLPDLKIAAHKDTQAARVAAERRERIVVGYDEGCKLDMMLPQLGRWLPGYGFGVITVADGFDFDNNPFPMATLRDPYAAFPSPWGVTQQPDRIALVREFDVHKLARMYPQDAHLLMKGKAGGAATYGSSERSWEGADQGKVEVVEYMDVAGTWTLVPDRAVLLDFTPNPIAPMLPFVVPKRFAFNKLIGHYDHVIGLMTANAKLNLLSLIAMEDAVFAETVVAGELTRGDTWVKGRNAINYVTAGTNVQKLGGAVNPQMFQEIDRLERQLRTTSGYSVTDDGQSPNSFVTGRGLDNLQAGVDNEVAEYQLVLQNAIEHVDCVRLAWDEKAYGNVAKPLAGKGSPEEYVPAKHIAGRYKTRRRYGVMAGWDDASKVVTGLQLLQAGIIDRTTMRENIRGLDDVPEVAKRIEHEQAEQALRDAMLAAAQQGDPKAVMALIEMLPASDTKQTLQKFYTPEGPEMSEQEAMMSQGPAVESQAPDSTGTILSRLLSSGEAQGGAQVVGSIG